METDDQPMEELSENPEFGKMEKHLIDTLGYTRIDQNILSKFTQTQIEKNAIHGTLSGYSMITRYHVFQKPDLSSELLVLVQIGDHLCGHPGIVHGGIISAIFDNTFGWLYITGKLPPSFTANLTINFRKPLYANSVGIVKAVLEKTEGRKIFMKASWEGKDNEIYAEATTLFVIPKTGIPSSELGEVKKEAQQQQEEETVSGKRKERDG
jgi:acyl-coenzyme A thioesterase PaaI-like protein